MTDNKNQGLLGKYRVERVDGTEAGPVFVLAPRRDSNAVPAMASYIAAVAQEGFHKLAEELFQQLYKEVVYPELLVATSAALAVREAKAALQQLEHEAAQASARYKAVAKRAGMHEQDGNMTHFTIVRAGSREA